ncbi:MAG: Gfo/Idh/MocA family protein [Planctomycetota bacterium]
MKKKIHVSRRDFIQTTLATGAFISARRSLASTLPTARLNFAVIGVGGIGASTAALAAESGQIVAICDVDGKQLEKSRSLYSSARLFTDFREILPAMSDGVDAVFICTPNHTHATIAAEFIRASKHVFCEKPLAHTFIEGRKLVSLSEEKEIVTTMNLQGTLNNGFTSLLNLLQQGEIGHVDEIHVWSNRPVWPTGMVEYPSSEPVPSDLDWSGFLGPCNDPIGYSSGIHPFQWRGYTSFGDGALGDMGPHMLVLPLLAFDLRNPVRIRSEKDSLAGISFPKSTRIDFEFEKTRKRDAIKLSWYDGRRTPSAHLFRGETIGSSGVLFVGREGTLIVLDDYSSKGKVISKSGATKVIEKQPSESAGRENRLSSFVQSIVNPLAAVPIATFAEVAGPLNDLVSLGNISLRTQDELRWDASASQFLNHPDLNSLLHRDYRTGFNL